jgi:hypothetical protein
VVFGGKDCFNVFEDRAVRAVSDGSKNKSVLDLFKRQMRRSYLTQLAKKETMLRVTPKIHTQS